MYHRSWKNAPGGDFVPMAEWKKKDLRLEPNTYGWKSNPRLWHLRLDRRAIRFDYPVDWKVSADEDSLKVRDQPEPDDNCVLAVSHMHLPPDPGGVRHESGG